MQSLWYRPDFWVTSQVVDNKALGEGQLEFRAEAFNMFNHVNLGLPN
jgi:hypothetical protein